MNLNHLTLKITDWDVSNKHSNPEAKNVKTESKGHYPKEYYPLGYIQGTIFKLIGLFWKKKVNFSCKINNFQSNIIQNVRWHWAEILVNNRLDLAEVNITELEVVMVSTTIKVHHQFSKHLESLCTCAVLYWTWNQVYSLKKT